MNCTETVIQLNLSADPITDTDLFKDFFLSCSFIYSDTPISIFRHLFGAWILEIVIAIINNDYFEQIYAIVWSCMPYFFFCYQQFFIFIFLQTPQHNIQNKTKQNSRHILNI